MLENAEALVSSGDIAEVIIVGADNSPDPFEGTMYVNSITWGNYEDFMTIELIDWVESTFRAIPDKNSRALVGQSMGAYGAFRYGILHKDKYKAFVAHAGMLTFNKEIYLETARLALLQENQPGPPYSYAYTGSGFTSGTFLFCGAFSPNPNSTQNYINPPIVDFMLDENGEFIDTVMDKFHEYEILENLIHQVAPEDSLGIFFGCGTNDSYLLYPSHTAMKDTLDSLGIPNVFYSHGGGHGWPDGFMDAGLIFLDSAMSGPITGMDDISRHTSHNSFECYPNPVSEILSIQLSPNTLIKDAILFSATGEVIIELPVTDFCNGDPKLDISNLIPGVYLLLLHSEGSRCVKKIIKL